MIISISGFHGTGKSAVGKAAAEKLGLKYYSTGEAFRDIAKDMNMSLEDFSYYVENHPEIDEKLDNKILDIGQEGDIVIDSQLSGHLLKEVADDFIDIEEHRGKLLFKSNVLRRQNTSKPTSKK